jgi:hypothetical protein
LGVSSGSPLSTRWGRKQPIFPASGTSLSMSEMGQMAADSLFTDRSRSFSCRLQS